MLLNKVLENPNHTLQITVNKEVTFNEQDIYLYKNRFKDLVNQELLVSKNFEDNLWVAVDEFGSKIKFKFLNSTFLNAIKVYILIIIDRGTHLKYTASLLQYINQSILLSDGFNIEIIDDFIGTITHFSENKRTRISLEVIRFLKFINHKDQALFMDELKKFIKYERFLTNRKLPPYKDILLFDDLVDKFINTATVEQKLEYFPILLWWKLTTIIPLRPIEFCLLSYNCIEKRQNKFFITVPRKKQEFNSSADINIENTFEIPDTLYKFINFYRIHTAERKFETKHLFTYETYSTFSKNSRPDQFGGKKGKLNYYVLQQLLHSFYRNIIQIKNSYPELTKIKLGDTRHLAICNMMLQGFNMLSIAKLAGHRRIRTQQSYWSHIDYFVQSYVYILAENIRTERLNTVNSPLNINSTIRKSLLKQSKGKKKVRVVEHGYCNDEHFPFACSECAHCPSFIFHPIDYDEGITWLKEQSTILNQRIENTIHFLKFFFTKRIQTTEELTNDSFLLDQEQLKGTTSQLKDLLNKKAYIKSLIPKEISGDLIE
ncbi:hypothetical protein [Bacillus cereus]|uniref:hypothetical protein n=1 Tax=Bacillus cereus TaxID=1396 RepID=UPI000BF84250|nr:hypothetical protein [Bacillus cereus]PFO83582.1 hypothetical protein COJ77_08305 [Bacillus cereus]